MMNDSSLISELEKNMINTEIGIPFGSSRTFLNQMIQMHSNIVVDGEVIFDHCEIIFDDDSSGFIRIEKTGSLRFVNCTIREAAAKMPKYKRIFSCWTDSSIEIDHCKIIDTRNFVGVEKLTLTDCQIENAGANFLYCKNDGFLSEVTFYTFQRCVFLFNKQVSLRRCAIIDFRRNKCGALCMYECSVLNFKPERTGGWFIRLRHRSDFETYFAQCRFEFCERLFKGKMNIDSCVIEEGQLRG